MAARHARGPLIPDRAPSAPAWWAWRTFSGEGARVGVSMQTSLSLAGGRLLTNEQPAPRPAVYLVDVLRDAMQPGRVQPDGLPAAHAATWLLDGLAAVDGLVWFIAEDPLTGARPVSTADVWRPAYPSGLAYLEQVRTSGESLLSDPCMDLAEAQARGLKVPADGFCSPGGVWLTDAQWRALPALPELSGPAGTLPWLRSCPLSVSLFDEQAPSCRLAVLQMTAQALPWHRSNVAALPSAFDRHALIQSFNARNHAEKWTDGHRAELLRQYRELTGEHGQGRPLQAKDAKGELSKLWNLAPSTIHAYLTMANKEADDRDRAEGVTRHSARASTAAKR